MPSEKTLLLTKRAVRAIYADGGLLVDEKNGFAFVLHRTDPEAPRSICKINLRHRSLADGTLSDETVSLIGQALASLIEDRTLAMAGVVLAGIPNAGLALARATKQALAEKATLELLNFSKIQSEPVPQFICSGEDDALLKANPQVLIVDDVVTRAISKTQFADSVQARGGKVRDIVVFIDRSHYSVTTLSQWGYTLHSVLDFKTFLKYGLEYGYLTEPVYLRAVGYDAELRAYEHTKL